MSSPTLEILCILKCLILDRSYGADLPETRKLKPMAAVYINHHIRSNKTCVRRLFWELLVHGAILSNGFAG